MVHQNHPRIKTLWTILFLFVVACNHEFHLGELLDSAQYEFDKKNYDKAETLYRRALYVYPQSGQARGGLAFTLLAQKQLSLLEVLRLLTSSEQVPGQNPDDSSIVKWVRKFTGLSPEEMARLKNEMSTKNISNLEEFYQLTEHLKTAGEIWRVILPSVREEGLKFCREIAGDLASEYQCQILDTTPSESTLNSKLAMIISLMSITLPYLYLLKMDSDLNNRIDVVEDSNTLITEIKNLQDANPQTPSEVIQNLQLMTEKMNTLKSKLVEINSPLFRAFLDLTEFLISLFDFLPEKVLNNIHEAAKAIEETSQKIAEFSSPVQRESRGGSLDSIQSMQNTLNEYNASACATPSSSECINYKQAESQFCTTYRGYITENLILANSLPSQCQQ